jgi:hypothetical protein
VPGHRQYGSPGFSKTDAWGEINDTVTEATTSEDVELDEETAERLRDMGYL